MGESWKIPGTVLTEPREEAQQIDRKFQAMFSGGGMMLSQVAAVSGLECHTIQNWVKRGFFAASDEKALYIGAALPDFDHQCAQAGANAGADLQPA